MKIIITREKVERRGVITPKIIFEEDFDGDVEIMGSATLRDTVECMYIKTNKGEFRFGIELRESESLEHIICRICHKSKDNMITNEHGIICESCDEKNICERCQYKSSTGLCLSAIEMKDKSCFVPKKK